MMIRTSSKTVTFVKPFLLNGLDGMQSAGSYTVETDEEFLDTVLPSAFRRITTLIHVHKTSDDPGVTQAVTIDPEELDAALSRDAALAETQAERPAVSFARRQTHRAHKMALFDAKKPKNS